MKKLVFGLVATIMLSVTGNAQRLNVKDFRNIGIEHNRLLDAVYNKILTEKTVNKDLAIETLTIETQKSGFLKTLKILI